MTLSISAPPTNRNPYFNLLSLSIPLLEPLIVTLTETLSCSNAYGNLRVEISTSSPKKVNPVNYGRITVNPIKLETGLRPNSAGVPYTSLLRIEAMRFPTFWLLLHIKPQKVIC